MWKLLANLYDCVEVVWLVSTTIESDFFYDYDDGGDGDNGGDDEDDNDDDGDGAGGWMTKGGSATQLNKVCNSANSVNCTQVEESIPSQTIDRAANVEISNYNL